MVNAYDQWSDVDVGLYDGIPVTMHQWAKREVPEKRYLLGALFSTTTRAMLSAPTGHGKTNVILSMAAAMAAGEPFCHWCGRGTERRPGY